MTAFRRPLQREVLFVDSDPGNKIWFGPQTSVTSLQRPTYSAFLWLHMTQTKYHIKEEVYPFSCINTTYGLVRGKATSLNKVKRKEICAKKGPRCNPGEKE